MKTNPASKENYFHYNRNLKDRARELRNFQTNAEETLWEIVRKKRLYGFAFTRQRPAEDYIVDFMCKKLLLILEADGEIHEMDDQREYDAKRTRELEAVGFYIMRFGNWEIEHRADEVEAEIRAWIREKAGIQE